MPCRSPARQVLDGTRCDTEPVNVAIWHTVDPLRLVAADRPTRASTQGAPALRQNLARLMTRLHRAAGNSGALSDDRDIGAERGVRALKAPLPFILSAAAHPGVVAP